jgi:hypothetical protein
VNVVDTPGTNVILSRQQRLTEEYVPRADLVLFVLSADRPFTESEVSFLKYIRCGDRGLGFRASSPLNTSGALLGAQDFSLRPSLITAGAQLGAAGRLAQGCTAFLPRP